MRYALQPLKKLMGRVIRTNALLVILGCFLFVEIMSRVSCEFYVLRNILYMLICLNRV